MLRNRTVRFDVGSADDEEKTLSRKRKLWLRRNEGTLTWRDPSKTKAQLWDEIDELNAMLDGHRSQIWQMQKERMAFMDRLEEEKEAMRAALRAQQV